MNNRRIGISAIAFAITASLICFATGYIPASYEPLKGHTWLYGNIIIIPIVAALSFFITMKILAAKHWTFAKNKSMELAAKIFLAAILSFILILPIFWILAILTFLGSHFLFGTSIDM